MRRLALLMLLLAGCAPGTTAPAFGTGAAPGDSVPGSPPATPGGSNGPPGSPAPMTTPPGATGGGTLCGQLVPVSSSSLADLGSAPGARVRVRAELSGMAQPTSPWTWTVLYGEGAGTLVDVIPLDDQRSVVEVPLEKEGRYQIAASTGGCSLAEIAHATDASGRLAQFRVRLAPPAGQPWPVQESALQVKTGTVPPAPLPFVLLSGTEVTLEPHDATGTGSVSSYIRITDPRTSLSVEGHTALLPFKARLLPSVTYDVLFVPDGDVAPVLQLGKAPSAIAVLPLQLSPGTALGGKLVDAAGAAVKDARVILRAGVLTSTVGASDGGGAFALHARAGTFALSVSPPPASGLPELTLGLEPGSGLAIPDAASAGSADIAWAPLATAPATLTVVSADGRPAVGARLSVQRRDPLASAGTLTLRPGAGPAVSMPLQGWAHADGVVAADGTVTLAPLPAGSYQVTLVPGDADVASGLTSLPLDLTPGSRVSAPLALAARVTLHGQVSAPAGTRIYAVARAATPARAPVSAVIAADGSFSLAVDPGRDHLVWADPPAGKGAARAQLAIVKAGTTEVPMRALPRALAFPARVSASETRAGVAAVVVQLFCDPQSPSCLDPTLPLAEAVTGPDGAVSLLLPDPGSP
jgi:hypothetical protein